MVRANHRQSQLASNHSVYQTDLLADQTQLLQDIKTNTNSVNLNTDTLEAKLTDGSQITQIKGNTAGDGSGDSHFLHVDSNGNAKVTVVNAPTIIPHSELNSGTNDDPRDSIAVGLRGRTTITDASTETFLKTDSTGALEVRAMGINDSATNQQIKTDNSGNVSAFLVSDAIIKPSNVTNGDHASFSASSVATMLRARTNISDNTTGQFLLCDAQGHLQMDVVSGGGRDMELTTSSAKTHPTGTLTSSDVLTVTNQVSNGITILCEANTLGSDFTLNNVKISSTSGGTYYPLNSLTHIEETNGANAKIIHIKNINAKFIKVEMTQSTGSSKDVTYTVTV